MPDSYRSSNGEFVNKANNADISDCGMQSYYIFASAWDLVLFSCTRQKRPTFEHFGRRKHSHQLPLHYNATNTSDVIRSKSQFYFKQIIPAAAATAQSRCKNLLNDTFLTVLGLARPREDVHHLGAIKFT